MQKYSDQVISVRFSAKLGIEISSFSKKIESSLKFLPARQITVLTTL